MYIAPNSTIIFLSNVPLDNTFDHTIYFTSAAIQELILKGYKAHTLTAQSYVREMDGRLRVDLTTAQLYNCNYVMFQNTSYSTKWFYAFITKVEYRSNGTSYVTFELDPMQTWMFDYQVDASFIEREHSTTDEPGDNLVPENLETGDYMSTAYSKMLVDHKDPFHGPNITIVFGCTFAYNPNAQTTAAKFPDFEGGACNGIFTGLALHGFTDIGGVATGALGFLHDVVEAKKLNGIVCCYMMYSDFFETSNGTLIPSLQPKVVPIGNKPTTFPGVASIRNKKLLTAPYIQLYVTNNQGCSAAFPFEYFANNAVEFVLYGSCAPDPAVLAVPADYKNVTDENWDEKMVLKGFPVCSFDVDSFKAWLAQAGSSLAVSNMSAALSSAVGVGTGNPASALSYASSVANTLQQVYIHSVQPPQVHGNVSGNVLYSCGQLNFSYCTKYIRPEFVRIIDDYFDKFGYATHRVKVPNVFNGNFGNRPHWNFVQTKRCSLSGNVPADDMRKIASIYDAGITFWKTASEVGNYSLSNAPSAPVTP